jgi:hypothetical protein
VEVLIRMDLTMPVELSILMDLLIWVSLTIWGDSSVDQILMMAQPEGDVEIQTQVQWGHYRAEGEGGSVLRLMMRTMIQTS